MQDIYESFNNNYVQKGSIRLFKEMKDLQHSGFFGLEEIIEYLEVDFEVQQIKPDKLGGKGGMAGNGNAPERKRVLPQNRDIRGIEILGISQGAESFQHLPVLDSWNPCNGAFRHRTAPGFFRGAVYG